MTFNSKLLPFRILKCQKLNTKINLNDSALNFELYHLLRDNCFNQRPSWNQGAIQSLIIDGKPLSYIVRNHTFLNSNLTINPGVLVPRNETEEYIYALIEAIKTSNQGRTDKLRILDLCTGSGCIALALGCSLRNVEIVAIDKSYTCYLNALDNLNRNKDILKSNNSEIHLRCLDISEYNNFVDLNQKFDLIISNPPYIQKTKKHKVDQNVLKYERHSALFPRKSLFNGLYLHSKILDISKNLLKSASIPNMIPRIVLEFDGKYQIRMFEKLLKKYEYDKFKFKKDFRNIPRSLWVY